MAEHYLSARSKKLLTKTIVARQDMKDNNFAESGGQRDVIKCLACNGRGYKAIDCPNRASTS